ncbi:minor tail protein [Gordonia phage Twister6]|uniref:Minor tail protein n=2 Tax=Wizardvirus TaxID=2169658 RepID=A0A345KR62_9CAUD|nr:minor tail protein [Gordonia phage Twister6]YP_010096640.1 minor tail protein [Gordonia phage Danyall]AOE44944.1 minor tail protein [Gordonia phage Twister6]AXH45514.1 minor tail protein [Gordonia phage Danyall]
MTSPNLGPGDVPDHDDAANSGHLSDLQGQNPSAALQGQVSGLTGPQGLIGNLIMGALGGIVDDVQGFQQPGKRKKSLQSAAAFAQDEAGGASPSAPRPVRDIISIITGVSNGDTGHLSSWMSNLGRLFRGEPLGTDPGGWFSGVLDFGGMNTRLGEVEEAIADLDDIAPATPVTPQYAADINDMPTCSRDDLTEYYLSGSSSNGYTLGFRAAKYTPSKVTFNSVAPVDYTPIIVDRQGRPRKLRWRVGNDTSVFGIDAYYMALCVYNPATLAVEKVWDSGNIKDGVANTSSLQEVGVDMNINQFVTPGQILFAAHQQIAPGLAQSARSFACKPQPGGAARPGQLLDAWYFRTPGNHGSIPSSVAFSSLERRNDCIPWAAVSVDTTVTEAP